jgi:enediyne biosynthesis protein E4
LAQVSTAKGQEIILAAQNRAALKVFARTASSGKTIVAKAHEKKALIGLKNGQKRIQEFYRGGTFLSQGSRSVFADRSVAEITFFDGKNIPSRTLRGPF